MREGPAVQLYFIFPAQSNGLDVVYYGTKPTIRLAWVTFGMSDRATTAALISEPDTVVGRSSLSQRHRTWPAVKASLVIASRLLPFLPSACCIPPPVRMQLSLWSALLAWTSVTSAYVPESTMSTDLLAMASLAKLAGSLADGSLEAHLAEQGVSQDCDILEVGIRRE
jgi:hypothetical protein